MFHSLRSWLGWQGTSLPRWNPGKTLSRRQSSGPKSRREILKGTVVCGEDRRRGPWGKQEGPWSLPRACSLFTLLPEINRWFTPWSLFCRWRNRGTEKLSDFATVTGWGGPGLELRENLTLGLCPAHSHAASVPRREDFLQGNPLTPPHRLRVVHEEAVHCACVDRWQRRCLL